MLSEDEVLGMTLLVWLLGWDATNILLRGYLVILSLSSHDLIANLINAQKACHSRENGNPAGVALFSGSPIRVGDDSHI